MTDPQGNGPDQPIDTHFVSVQDWLTNLPPITDSAGRPRRAPERVIKVLASYATNLGDVVEFNERVFERLAKLSGVAAWRAYERAEATGAVAFLPAPAGTIRARVGLLPPVVVSPAADVVPPQPASGGHLYVLRFTGSMVKVGYTASPSIRLAEHRRAAAIWGHSVISSYTTPPFEGARKAERVLIEVARTLGTCVRGEWFELRDCTPLRLVAADLAGGLA
jgi:hypothetical protein